MEDGGNLQALPQQRLGCPTLVRSVSGIKLWYTGGREGRKGWVWKHSYACLRTCPACTRPRAQDLMLTAADKGTVDKHHMPNMYGLATPVQTAEWHPAQRHPLCRGTTDWGLGTEGVLLIACLWRAKCLHWAQNLWVAAKVCTNFTWAAQDISREAQKGGMTSKGTDESP